MNLNPYSPGDKVYVDSEGDRIFTVYGVYSDTEVSLGLYDYPDSEQDYLTDISILTKVKDDCVLCGDPLPTDHPGRNYPGPLSKTGECCDNCNITKVLPARLRSFNE